jgi:hypothetical protein
MREKPHEMAALVMMRPNWTPAPHLDRMAKEKHAASGAFRTPRTKFVKHISYIDEWKRYRVLIVEQVIDSSVTVAVGKHDANKVAGCKLSKSTLPRDRDLIQQFRRDRRCDGPRFLKQVPAYGVREGTGNVEAFAQRSPRPRYIPGRFSVGYPQKCGRSHRGIGLLSLSPRTSQKIV